MARKASLFALVCVLMGWSAFGVRVARAADSGISLLVLETPRLRWAERARGQLSDLPAQVSAVDVSSREPQAASARRWASRSEADVVAFLESDAGEADAGSGLYLVTLTRGETTRRRIAESWASLDPSQRSAALESSALALRSLLRSLLLERASTPSAEPEPDAEPSAEPEPDAEPSAEPSEVRYAAALGGGYSLDGQSSHGSLGLAAVLGVETGRFAWLVRAQLGLGSSFEIAGARIGLRRHSLSLEARFAAWSAGWVRLGPVVRAGLARSERRTTALSQELIVTEPAVRYESELGAGWRAGFPLGRSQRLGVQVMLAWLPETTRTSVVPTSGAEPISSLPWRFQPRLELDWTVLIF